MAQQLRPVYGVTPKCFNDHSGTGDLYVPSTGELTADAEALTYKDGALWVAPADGARITEIRLLTVDAAAAVIATLWIGTAHNAKREVGKVNVPLNSGLNGVVAAVNGLSATLFPGLLKDNAGNCFDELQAGETLFITAATADKLKSKVSILEYTAPV